MSQEVKLTNTPHFEGQDGLKDTRKYHPPYQWQAAQYWYPLVEKLLEKERPIIKNLYVRNDMYLNSSILTWKLVEADILTTDRSSGKRFCESVGRSDLFNGYSGTFVMLNWKTRKERQERFEKWMNKLNSENIDKIISIYLKDFVSSDSDDNSRYPYFLLNRLFDYDVIADVCAHESLSAIFREIGRSDIVDGSGDKVTFPNSAIKSRPKQDESVQILNASCPADNKPITEFEGQYGLSVLGTRKYHSPDQWRAVYYWHSLVEKVLQINKLIIERLYVHVDGVSSNANMLTWYLVETGTLTTDRSSGKKFCESIGCLDIFFRHTGILLTLNMRTPVERYELFADWMMALSPEDIRKIAIKYLTKEPESSEDITSPLSLLDKLFEQKVIADICAYRSLSAILRDIGRGDIVDVFGDIKESFLNKCIPKQDEITPMKPRNNIALDPEEKISLHPLQPINSLKPMESAKLVEPSKKQITKTDLDEFIMRDIKVTKYPIDFREEQGEGKIICTSCKFAWPSARLLPCDHCVICRTCILTKIGFGRTKCPFCEEKIEEVRRNLNPLGSGEEIVNNLKK